MFEFSFLIIFLFALYAKKNLYIHEHEKSIRDELEAFDSNLQAIRNQLEQASDYKLGSGHLYE